MRLSDFSDGWIGKRIRDRIDKKSGIVVAYDEINQTVTILFDDGEKRIIPHHRDSNAHQPFGVFYTNRYWDGPVK